ncbi:DUF2635 domain-containing protein [Variovorax sp. RCC_210]|uniref:DUF2635 domain-containing protein n=1 Tax=Variovorax sp. RCC_210 TaxID=3239217 RepID=UPI0035241BCA
MFLKPQPGVDVPDVERGGLLPADGREVIPSTYWQRRIDDGDVTEVKPADTPTAPVSTTTTTSKK